MKEKLILLVVLSGSYAFGLYNANIGNIEVNGGEVKSSSSNNNGAFGIYNENNGMIKINGGKINSNSRGQNALTYGIYNYSTGTIEINEGYINSNSHSNKSWGITNRSNGTIRMNGGNVHITSSNTQANGIENLSNGTVEIYDGCIICESQYDSTISRYEYSSCVVKNKDKGIVIIGTKGDGIVNTETPYLEQIFTGSGQGKFGIWNKKGTLKIYDGIIKGHTRALPTDSVITEIENNTTQNWQDDDKTLTLSTEAIDLCKIGETTYNDLQTAINAAGNNATTIELLRGAYYTNLDSSLNIASTQDITLDVKGFSISSAIEGPVFENSGKLKIVGTENGKIIGSNVKTIQNNNGATLEVNSGTVTNTNSSSNVIYNQGTLNVTGGAISGGTNSIYNTGIATISSGTVENIQNIGTANISSGTVGKVSNAGNGNLNISGGTVNKGIENKETAVVNMIAGTVSNLGSGIRYGIKNTSTNSVNITGGTISVNKYQTNYKAYGVYSTAGTVNIGTKNANIIFTPEITADTNAIYSESTLNIYDGTLKGKTSAVSGQINLLEDNSEINVTEISDESEYEIITLDSKSTKIARVGSNEYDTLYKAIDAISSAGTVTIQRDGVVAEIIDNLGSKDITIDLNGYNLKLYNWVQNAGTLKITDSSTGETGTLSSYKETPINNFGTFELIKGNISSNIYGIYNQTGGTVAITGGALTQNTYGIYAKSGTVNVNGGNINQNTYGTFAVGGTININSSNILNNEYGIYTSSGTTNINEVTITANTHEVYNYAGTVTITGASILSTSRAAIENETFSGTINVISGTITSSVSSGIQNIGTGTIQIGTNNGTVTNNSPIIQGETYGIANQRSGTIRFYDGTIKGKTGAIYGLYTQYETGYRETTNFIENYYCDTLKQTGTISPVAYIGSVGYTNLQSAINACLSEQTTIIQLANSINTETPFEIEEDQNVTIDLNGFTISSSSAEYTIENNGDLTIIDSTDTGSSNPERVGTISNTANTAINNTGTLILGTNDGTVRTKMPKIAGNTYGIRTTGTLNFYDGQITATEPLDGTVTNRPNGYIINKTTSNGISTLTLGR